VKAPKETPLVPPVTATTGPFLNWTLLAELGQVMLSALVCAVVFWLAGGTRADLNRIVNHDVSFHQLVATEKPFETALVAFFAMMITDVTRGWIDRYRHNRHFSEWYARRHRRPATEPASVVAPVETASRN
jgi:hypothetical protein